MVNWFTIISKGQVDAMSRVDAIFDRNFEVIKPQTGQHLVISTPTITGVFKKTADLLILWTFSPFV